jgi:hypothetical protein
LHSIVTSSSRPALRASAARQAIIAVRRGSAMSLTSPTDNTRACAANAAAFAGVTPFTQPAVSPSPSSHSTRSACSRNLDQVARLAGVFNASNPLVRSPSGTTSSAAIRSRAPALIRSTTPSQIPASTRARIVAAIRSRVENPGSSRPDLTSSSNATLIRSAG